MDEVANASELAGVCTSDISCKTSVSNVEWIDEDQGSTSGSSTSKLLRAIEVNLLSDEVPASFSMLLYRSCKNNGCSYNIKLSN